MKRIIIDPGHGGHDSGAVSPTGLKESDVVLEVGLLLRGYLVGFFDVAMTREDDTFVALSRRAEFANDRHADLFVSIHCNAAENPASGHEVWTSPGQTESDAVATVVFNSYCEEFPGLRARKELGDGDPDKEARFTVLVKTRMAAILYELNFIHTPEGHAWFTVHSNLVKAARAIANGIREYFRVPLLERETEPSQPVEPLPQPDLAEEKRREIKLAAQKIIDLLG